MSIGRIRAVSDFGETAPDIETGGRLIIDLSALQANWRMLADRVGPAECAAVVKADAYGIGATPASGALWQAGARTFFLVHPFEARQVRAVLPEATIYVLNGLSPDAAAIIAEIGARPVLGSLPEIKEWAGFCSANNLVGDAAIHVDTGMNRLGLVPDEAPGIAEKHRSGTLGFRPALVMSHLACADTPDHPLNARQLEAFRGIAALFPGVPASLANSAATLTSNEYAFDLCRPGIALYGGSPFGPASHPMKPVVRLEARIIQIREVAAGDTVGYGAAQRMSARARIAVLSLGYADGFPRSAGAADGIAGAHVVIAGRKCPLVGRVSMDLIAVDVTSLSPGSIRRGDHATILGDGITVDDLADRAGTIGFEILTRLGHRYRRIYV